MTLARNVRILEHTQNSPYKIIYDVLKFRKTHYHLRFTLLPFNLNILNV